MGAVMREAPWLSIIGLGEDGPEGLCAASRSALQNAEIIMGPSRHLSLLPELDARCIEWPVPFADGIAQLLTLRGQKVAVLASGDPFWFGAGATLARHVPSEEWTAFPGRSTFSLVAARLGWSLEHTLCLGLHAAPLSRLRPHLAPGQRMIVLLRDPAAVRALQAYLVDTGFGPSPMTVFCAVGGPREDRHDTFAEGPQDYEFNHPVCVAIDVAGAGHAIPCVSGIPDALFDTDGVMTKRPVRALTLSSLAPKPFERLWDIGGGSGSIGIEWLLSHPTTQATVIEPRADRLALIRSNAEKLGVDRLQVIEGQAPDALQDLALPDVVFIGGGLSKPVLSHLESLPSGTRLVANAVTLESQSMLQQAQARLGGELMKIELSHSTPVGGRHTWKPAYPIVQWSHTL